MIGDEFCKRSINEYFMLPPEKEFYTRTNFDVTATYFNSNSKNSLMGRLRDSLINQMNSQWQLPKIIAVILETDFTDYIGRKRLDQRDYRKCLLHLVNEFRKAIATFKDKLPAKSKRYNWPHTVWIMPVQHCNMHNESLISEFNTVLEETVAVQQHMSVLRLKQIWDNHDMSLYMHQFRRFTSDGLKKYWCAVDRTLKFCDKTAFTGEFAASNPGNIQQQHSKNSDAPAGSARKQQQHSSHSTRRDRFHWRRESPKQQRFKLPDPFKKDKDRWDRDRHHRH